MCDLSKRGRPPPPFLLSPLLVVSAGFENRKETVSRGEECEEEEIKRRDREEELVNTVKTLSERVGDQDTELAELKEDNNLLKKQIKELSVKENKPSGFRIFGTSKENVCSDNNLQDPQVKNYFHKKNSLL